MEDRKIKWGILGTANIAKTQVGPAILEAKNAELVALAGRNIDKMNDFNRVVPAKRTYLSYDALLDDPEVEAVYIPLPNGYHLEWAIKAMKKGKHVLCEKPLGCSVAEVEEMFKVSEETGMYLDEAFAYRHNPMTLKMKEMIDSGKIGELRNIEANFSAAMLDKKDIRYDASIGGGATYDLGCYTLGMILYLTGMDPINVLKHVEYDAETAIDLSSTVIIEFPNQVTATSYCSFTAAFNMSCRVVGTKGVLECMRPFNQKGDLEILFRGSGGEEKISIFSRDNYTLEVESLSDRIMNGGSTVVTKDDSLKNAALIDMILKK